MLTDYHAKILPAIAAAILVLPAVMPPPLAADRQAASPRPASPKSAPPRDVQTAPKGTAVIRGRVLAADSRRPLRRASVQFRAPELGSEPRTASTGADGRFEIRDLPAGRYDIWVRRSGYLSLSYGQRRPFELGKPLQVRDGETVSNVDFSLPRMGLITGRVLDEAGEPIAGVQMFAMRSMFFEGRRRMVPAGGFTATDDTGQYRILALTPATYYVMADTRETWTVMEGGEERVMGYMPTYYPGIADVAHARPLKVGVGQEASGIDFALVPGRAAYVSGIATDSLGRPLAGRETTLGQEFKGPGGASYSVGISASIAADGSFRFNNVSPGDYVLRVMTTHEIDGATVQESAGMPVTVTDAPIENLALRTSAGWMVEGRVTTESGDMTGVPVSRVIVSVRPADGEVDYMRHQPPPGNGRIRDNGTFGLRNILGPARIRVSAPDGWALKAVLHDGREVTDEVFELASGETLAGVEVVLTDRLTAVTGQITGPDRKPTTDATVLVFSADPRRWSDEFLYLRAARPDQQGRYEIRGLPPGEYLAIALEYVENNVWKDPQFLESIRYYAEPFRLTPGGSVDLPLKVTTPGQ